MRNKLKLVSILLSLAAISLGGCAINSSSSDASQSSEPQTSITSSSSTSSSSATSQSSSESSVPTSSSSEEEPPVVVHSAEETIQDICSALFGSAVVEEDYFSDGEDGFYTVVNFGAYGEEYLELAVSTVINYLPDYCVEISAPEAGTWGSGEAGYFAVYATEDYSVAVELGSYIYNSNLRAQISVYPVAE